MRTAASLRAAFHWVSCSLKFAHAKHSLLVRNLAKLLFLALLLPLSTALIAATVNEPAVDLKQGRVVGLRTESVERFLGIPYATPPLGELRWTEAQPLSGPAATLTATSFGPACVQTLSPRVPDLDVSEDCLTLNIWKPVNGEGPLPVMVWIHGGGFMNGSGRIPGEVLAREGVMVVSINYRLGPLGFFAHPQLTSKVANFGLTDAVQALRWMHDNIAAFGGDPDNVTIFGVSAGGMMVDLLLVSEHSQGLFHKAISQSGYISWPLPTTRSMAYRQVLEVTGATVTPAEQTGAEIVNPLLPGAPSEEALRAVDAAQLVAAVAGFWRPIVDGASIGDQPYRLLEERPENVQLITGGNSYEGSVMPYSGVDMSEYQRSWGSQKTEFQKLYREDLDQDVDLAYRRAFGDERYLMSAYLLGRAWQSKPASAWLYLLDKAIMPDMPGAGHGSDAALIFQGDKSADVDLQSIGRTLRRYWANFAKTGNPNGAAVPAWPQYSADSERWLVIDGGFQAQPVKQGVMPILSERLRSRELPSAAE